MVTMFSLFAEIERDLISMRTKEGLAAAKASGKKLVRRKGSLGKSKLDGREDKIKRLWGFLHIPPKRYISVRHEVHDTMSSDKMNTLNLVECKENQICDRKRARHRVKLWRKCR
jgi:hypothetical protein